MELMQEWCAQHLSHENSKNEGTEEVHKPRREYKYYLLGIVGINADGGAHDGAVADAAGGAAQQLVGSALQQTQYISIQKT